MLQVHDRLGDFEIIRLLGKGGMGEVYEARQFNPERLVALKVLAPWLADDEDSLRRFFQESGVPAKLDHPNIVRIITTGQTPDGIAYFTMHLVRGISLSEMIKRSTASPSSELPTRTVESAVTPSSAAAPSSDGAPPASPAPNFEAETNPPLAQEYRRDRFTAIARIGVQAARALAFAHQQGYLHRDIKPSNLMIDHHDHVYLVDFGLTRGLGPGGDSTNPGTLIGTPFYMSPEQAEGKPVDSRSDIYSLGITLYELATQGLGPFTANRDDRKAVLAQVRAGQTLPLRTLAPGIPAPLERIILKAMQLKADKRYASVADMAKDLEAFLGIASKRSSSLGKDTPALTSKRWSVWVGCAAVVLTITISLAAYLNRDPDPGGRPVEPGPNKPKVYGSLAQPPSLGDPLNLQVQVPLLDNNAAPRWSDRLFGAGKYVPAKDYFHLYPDSILALADPDRPNFEFTVEIAQNYSIDEIGIFFGCRRLGKDSSDQHHMFLVRWENHPSEGNPHGRITIGTGSFVQPNESRGAAVFAWLKKLPPGKEGLALGEWDKRNGWPFVKVKIQGENATVSVPNRPSIWFSLSELKGINFDAYQHQTTAGAVGVWSKKGIGLFKKAMLTPLP